MPRQFPWRQPLLLLLFLPLAVALLWLAAPRGIPAWDRALLGWLADLRTPWLDTAVAAFTRLGSAWLLWPAALAWAGLGRRRHGWRAALPLLSLALAAAAGYWTKLLVQRPRPDLFPLPGLAAGQASFPSLHTAQSLAFLLALALLLGRRSALAAALCLGLGIGASRLYLQVHYPSDVLAGACLGIACAAACRPWLEGYRSQPWGQT